MIRILAFFIVPYTFINCSGNVTIKSDDSIISSSEEKNKIIQLHSDTRNPINKELQNLDLDFDGMPDSINCEVTYIDEEASVITGITVYCTSIPQPFHIEGDWDVITNEHNAKLAYKLKTYDKSKLFYIIQKDKLSSIILPGFSYGSGRENFNILAISLKKISICDVEVFQHFYFEENLNNTLLIGSNQQDPLNESHSTEVTVTEVPWRAFRIIDCGLVLDSAATEAVQNRFSGYN